MPTHDRYQELDAWIDAHFDEEVRFLQELIRVPTDTPPGNNTPHAIRTAELLKTFGFDAEKHAVPQAEVEAHGLQSITNLIVRRPYGAKGMGLTVALNAHGDVVPPGDGWTTDPYGGEIKDGSIYGRASAVSKSDFASFTFAVRALESLQAQLKGTVELHFTYDEEFGGELGPGWLLKHGLTKPDLLIAAGFSLVQDLDYIPEELAGLDRTLSDTYYGNFSVFQSVPDSWAIKQLFPVMPIHRLDEQPTRHAVISDVSCDSDGKIDAFIDQRDVKKTLLLHPYDGHHYYIGVFLIGAYQEILGDLHNLFGDTNAVHVDLSPTGEVELNQILKGETVSEVLDYVQFKGRDLMDLLQVSINTAVKERRITPPEAARFVKFYEDGLNGYTYLEEPDGE